MSGNMYENVVTRRTEVKPRKTEHPILMCGEMVRAILVGKKTETRRMAGLKDINKEPDTWYFVDRVDGLLTMESDNRGWEQPKHPYGVAGDTLLVRETWRVNALSDEDSFISVRYKADDSFSVDNFVPEYEKYSDKCLEDCKKKNRFEWNSKEDCPYRWRSSIHMPRWASRITLTVKDVILERLHEITDEGARAEGVKDRAEYEKLWKQLNGEESWNLNPWVWVVKFDVKEVRK